MSTLKVNTVSGIGTEGIVLNGGLHFRSLNYMTLPKGDTTQRGRTLELFLVDHTGSNNSEGIEFISHSIRWCCNAVDFGDLSVARRLVVVVHQVLK